MFGLKQPSLGDYRLFDRVNGDLQEGPQQGAHCPPPPAPHKGCHCQCPHPWGTPLPPQETLQEKIFEKTTVENFPLGKERVNQAQEVQRVPGRIKPLRHTVIRLTKTKDKDEIVKATNSIQGNSHKVISRFLNRPEGIGTIYLK